MTVALAPDLASTPLPHAGCSKCRTLPAGPPLVGTLYLSASADEPLSNLTRYFEREGIPVAVPQPGLLAVEVGTGAMDRLAGALPTKLTETELQGTRAMVVPPGRLPDLSDFMAARPLATLFAAVRHQWLGDLLRTGRLETHFQPIAPADDPGEVFGYECLVRGRDEGGKLISPKDLFAAARAADLLFHLDRQARLTAIRAAVRHRVASRLFLNFNPSSIYTPSACLRTTFRAVEEAGLDPSRITFEVVESEEVRDTGHLLGILEVYRAAGFAVALDDVGAGYSSLNLLARLRPDFVKLDMGLTRGVDADPYKGRVAGKLLEMARDLGIRTVVEGVETVGEWEWARENRADFVQGYLFARPAAEPPTPTPPAAVGRADTIGACSAPPGGA